MSTSTSSSDLYDMVKIVESDGTIKIRKYCKKSGWLREEEIHRNGKLEGERKKWYANGQMSVLEFYVHGERRNRKTWHRNGKRNMEEHYLYDIFGMRIRRTRVYLDINENLQEQISFEGKELVDRTFFLEDGQTDQRFNFGRWHRKFRTLE